MKTCIRGLFLLPVVITGLGLIMAGRGTGQTFTTLHSFTATPASYPYTNSDGADPTEELFLSGNTLYGTAVEGGSGGSGTVFAIKTDGTGFTNLHSFTGSGDGLHPYAGLILSGDTLYGTASFGGSWSNGTVFRLNTDGTGFTNLHSFGATVCVPYCTNSEGANPLAGLLLSGNTLYGTAGGGGSSGNGTAFAVHTDGTAFTNLYSFTVLNSGATNSDGASPYAGLTLSGNSLYGTARNDGSSGNGTVFALNTNGTSFTNLHSFTALDPVASTNKDGANPVAALVLLSNTLYGTAEHGGNAGNGTVFSLSFMPPQLTIFPSGANVVLTWPTNYAGFTLQSATYLASPVWTTNLPSPVVVNGQNTVTNPISGTQQFFRLSQ